MRIDTEVVFEAEKERHLKNIEAIRVFILGDENNQPQVTYCPKMAQFDRLLLGVKDWVKTSYFEGNDE